MIGLTGGRAIFLATGVTDLRKSFTGLYALVREHLRHEPLSGAVFGFCNRRRDTVKLLCYDQGGFWICAKRLVGPYAQAIWAGGGVAVGGCGGGGVDAATDGVGGTAATGDG